MESLLVEFGSRLRELRFRRQFTQETLAERAGLSYKFISEIERGMANPTLMTMAILAEALDCDVRALLGPQAEPSRTLTAAQAARIEDAIRVLHSIFPSRGR